MISWENMRQGGFQLKEIKKKKFMVLSREDQMAFFDCCKGTFYDNFFYAAVTTGMRIGELAALRWEDVDIKYNRGIGRTICQRALWIVCERQR